MLLQRLNITQLITRRDNYNLEQINRREVYGRAGFRVQTGPFLCKMIKKDGARVGNTFSFFKKKKERRSRSLKRDDDKAR